MAARKRTVDQRAFDLEWIVERADEGLAPTAILRRAGEPVDVGDFEHIEDAEGRKAAVEKEQRRRESVGKLTVQQVSYDLRYMRRRSLEAGDDRYRPILDRTVEELARLGFADLRSVIEWGKDGAKVRDCYDLPEAEAAIVSGVTVKTITTTTKDGEAETVVEAKIDTHSKVAALKALLRYLGGSTRRVEIVDTAPLIADIEQVADDPDASDLDRASAVAALEDIASGQSALKIYQAWKDRRG